jgi:AraC-like DNA-binding protein
MKKIEESFLKLRPEVLQVSVLEFANKYSTQYHKSCSHELLYVLDGKMTLHLEGNLEFHAVPGDILLIPRYTLHRDEFRLLRGLKILFIAFHWEADSYFPQVDNRTLIHLSYEGKTEARRRIEFLRTFWTEENSPEEKIYANDQFHSILLLFYFDQLKYARTRSQNRGNTLPLQELAARARDYLRQNYASNLSLKETAEHLKISAPYLSRIFHEEMGVGFNKYLTEQRLNEAGSLLLNTTLQVAEIAHQCGFSSSSYFIKVFSNHFGVTPKEFSAKRFEPKK